MTQPDRQPMSVEEARANRVCRICGKPDKFQQGDALVLNFGQEYAHRSCLGPKVARDVPQVDRQPMSEERRNLAAAMDYSRSLMEAQREIVELEFERYRLTSERDKLAEAIRTHRSQTADDRCWMDNDKLYEALGDGIKADHRIGDKAAMLHNCERFVENCCIEGGPWKSYADLEAELAATREELEGYIKAAVEERDTARAEAAEMKEQLTCCRKFYIGMMEMYDGEERPKWQALIDKMDRALSGTAAASLQAELVGLRERVKELEGR